MAPAVVPPRSLGVTTGAGVGKLPGHGGMTPPVSNQGNMGRSGPERSWAPAVDHVLCIPNFSEGRRPEVVAGLVDAVGSVPDVVLLDYSADAGHNRAVITFAGPGEAVLEAALRATRRAAATIDLNQHSGSHPRMGATDVVPFVPLGATSMAECVALAHRFGRLVGEELGIPVYLYEHAATSPARRNLADVRRGEFEGLRRAITEPGREPDYGPRQLHPTAGAVAVGARPPLIAYNVNLATADLHVAKAVARAVRGSSGGLANVKALGMPLEGGQAVQVSMNLTDYAATPIHRALELVRREAARYGVAVAASELVGLVPEAALLAAAAYYLQLQAFDPLQILEHRLEHKQREREAPRS